MPGERIAVGVDIGGTKVAAGLVDERGEVLFHTRVAMNATGTAQDAMACVHAAIRATLDARHDLRPSIIGVASPGPLQLPAGIVLQTPNLPCWRNFPLGDEIRRAYGLRTYVDNDANAAGLAEALWGAGAPHRYVFYATLGTGIGTAIVLNQSLYYGRTGEAAEGGHMTLDYRAPCNCGCGKRGCLEGLASGPSIARRAVERIRAGADGTAILAAAAGDAITAKHVATAWRGGDPLATEILRETADLLAIWLGNIIDLLEPDIIVVGGGLSSAMSGWFDHIRQQLPSCSINTRAAEIPLVQAKYGADAGIAGAGALCFVEPGRRGATGN